MADGPCGEEFKQAFSCFVYSEAEPKGIDCVEKFRGMQECFRKYPDIYGSEAEDLEAEEEDEGFDLVSRAEAALALPDEHFLEKVAKEAPTKKEAEAAASLE
ncbi:Oxidoreductase [Rhodosporidiobolus nylandii]